MTTHSGSTLWMRPTTRLGNWAVVLLVTFVLACVVFWMLENFWMDFAVRLTVLTGLASVILSLVAIIGKHERSWMLWLSIILPLLYVLFWLLNFLLLFYQLTWRNRL